MAAATIPVSVTEDAAARVRELGLRQEFEQMLDEARRAVSHLTRLRVTLEYDPAPPEDDPQVVIWARRDYNPADGETDLADWNFARWQAQAFPPEVCMHFVLISLYGDVDEG
jgi:hypothetical protein